MSQEAILEKVRSIVAEQLSVDSGEVKPESNFQNDLGADSLDLSLIHISEPTRRS